MKDTRAEFNVTLNGYRGLCAMFVFVFHLGSAGVIAWPGGSLLADAGYNLWASLSYGVDMFFMISGFVILGSLLRHDRVGLFIQDRIVRIFTAWIPALLAVTAMCVALRLKVFADVSFIEGFWIFLANFFLLPPLAPVPLIHIGSWSLTYEWVFYLTAAAGALAHRRAPGALWATAVWAVPAALFICMYPRAMFFVTGVLVFKYRDRLVPYTRWLKFPLVSLLVFLIAWRCIGIDDDAHATDTLTAFFADERWLFALIAFLASLHMFACVCLNSSRQVAFLNGRTFQFLGRISYSFYLWHVLVMSAAKRLAITYFTPMYGETISFVSFALLSLGVAIPISWLSWRVFEVMLARRLRQALHRPPVVARAVSVP